MADDGKTLFGDLGKLEKAAKSAEKATDDFTTAQTEAYKETRQLSNAMAPAIENYQNFDRASKEATKSVHSLSDALKEQKEKFREFAQQNLTVNKMISDAGQATRNFAGDLLKLIGVGAQYNRLLKELRAGQELHSKAMLTTSASIGKASANLQKYVDTVNSANRYQATLIRQLHISKEEAEAAQKAVLSNFATQIGAYKDMQGTTKGLMKDTVVLAKVFGTDTATAADFMRNRLESSNKTLKETQKETFLVAGALDTYTQKLKDMGERALKTGNIMKEDFLKIIRQANDTFETGALDVGAYAKALVPLLTRMKAAGFTTKEMRVTSQGMAKMMEDLSSGKLKSLFSVQAAQEIVANMSRFSESTQVRLRSAMKSIQGMKIGMESPQALSMLLDAAKGDSKLMQMVLQKMQEGVGKGAVSLEMVAEYTGGNRFLASKMLESVGKGGEFYESINESSEKTGDAAKESTNWQKKLTDMVSKGQKPTDLKYKIALKTYETIESIKNWLKYTLKGLLVGILAAVGRMALSRGGGIMDLLGGGRRGRGRAGRLRGLFRRIRGRGRLPKGYTATAGVSSRGVRTLQISKAAPMTKGARAASMLGKAGRGAGMALRGAGAVVGKVALPLAVAAAIPYAIGEFKKIKGITDVKGISSAVGKTAAEVSGVNLAGELTGALAERGLGEGEKRTLGKTKGMERFQTMVAEGMVTKGLMGNIKAGISGKGGIKGFAAGAASAAMLPAAYIGSTLASGAMSLLGYKRSKKQEKILAEIQRTRVTRRSQLTKREINAYRDYVRIIEKSKKWPSLMTEQDKARLADAKKFTKKYKRQVDLYTEGVRKSIAGTQAGQYSDVMQEMKGMDMSQYAKIKDPKERTKAIMDELIRRSTRLYKYRGGKTVLQRLLSGKGDPKGGILGKTQGTIFAAQMKAAGIDIAEARKLTPELVDKWQLAIRQSGAHGAGVGGALKGAEAAKWEAVRQERLKKGLGIGHGEVAAAYLQKEKEKQAAAAAPNITVAGGDQPVGGMAQRGKYDANTGTMTYQLTQTTEFKIDKAHDAAATANELAKGKMRNTNASKGGAG